MRPFGPPATEIAEQSLPRFIPSCDFYEAHRSKPISAKNSDIIAAVSALDMRADVVADLLLKMRELPSRMSRLRITGPHDRSMPLFGFESFVTLHRDDDELSLGLIGRFWRPDFGLVPVRDVDEFMRHADRKDAKLVLQFRAVEAPQCGYCLEIKTFVYCPNRSTKLLFIPYWLVIRLASGWIRKRTLSAVERALA
jgi:hypothetical protein